MCNQSPATRLETTITGDLGRSPVGLAVPRFTSTISHLEQPFCRDAAVSLQPCSTMCGRAFCLRQ